ncbi:MAG TPA: TIM44-like domain-containing protein [Spirochaetota bacterium]|mgnify:CR=1 FL=1|nr:TIM44-like domain-containing protein [Spirochaetota bacterium]HOD14581.1 TIM44-like domain-containing protein [Spirochaetota bacterium]HPG51006.1 TIM44-like domain-containing protein [Spirochaetota bacterium]HPN13163.1 TIM44-like domain-containing protein [Spirochaetota bacterium]
MLYLKRRHVLYLFAVLLVAALAGPDLLARAGGGGDFSGGDNGGGGGDGWGVIIYLLIRVILELPFPLNVIVAGIIIAGFIIFTRVAKKKVKAQSILNKLPAGDEVKKAAGYDAFIKNSPDFNEEVFKNNVRDAFMKIQKAWEAQDLSQIRKFISDGVYQRFNTQFKMMQLLKQKNTITNINIKNIYIDRVDVDGLYDIIQTAIHASVTDNFTSELDPSLNQGGTEEFVEYWSFLKKRGKPRTDIYQTDQCPNCGAPLPADMGEVSKCASCGTLTNSGEYDWVLSEITQADDYVGTHPKLGKSAELTEKVRSLIDENEDFSVQLIEDKASNGYLQIITAQALGDSSIMRRFVSDDVFAKVPMPAPGKQIAYNRIYLNDVYLVGVAEEGDRNVLAIAVKSSFQRVKLADGKAGKLDYGVISQTEVVLMSRDKNAAGSKGSLYAHSCPNCGAPVENSLEVKCKYCGSVMNSTGKEWIITGLMSMDEYQAYLAANSASFSYSADTALIDKLYDVRDFAFNNMMVVLAADGTLHDAERQFASDLAKKWGYDLSKLEPFFQMAQNGRLVVKMPQDTKKQKKIYKLMVKAAQADQNVSPEEQQLLDTIKKQYGIDDAA